MFAISTLQSFSVMQFAHFMTFDSNFTLNQQPYLSLFAIYLHLVILSTYSLEKSIIFTMIDRRCIDILVLMISSFCRNITTTDTSISCNFS